MKQQQQQQQLGLYRPHHPAHAPAAAVAAARGANCSTVADVFNDLRAGLDVMHDGMQEAFRQSAEARAQRELQGRLAASDAARQRAERERDSALHAVLAASDAARLRAERDRDLALAHLVTRQHEEGQEALERQVLSDGALAPAAEVELWRAGSERWQLAAQEQRDDTRTLQQMAAQRTLPRSSPAASRAYSRFMANLRWPLEAAAARPDVRTIVRVTGLAPGRLPPHGWGMNAPRVTAPYKPVGRPPQAGPPVVGNLGGGHAGGDGVWSSATSSARVEEHSDPAQERQQHSSGRTGDLWFAEQYAERTHELVRRGPSLQPPAAGGASTTSDSTLCATRQPHHATTSLATATPFVESSAQPQEAQPPHTTDSISSALAQLSAKADELGVSLSMPVLDHADGGAHAEHTMPKQDSEETLVVVAEPPVIYSRKVEV